MQLNAHCSTVYNSQDMKENLMSINKGTDKENIVHIYSGILFSCQKNEILPFTATRMDLEIIILTKVRHTETNVIYYHLYVESKKVIQINFFTKQTHRL